MDLQIGDFKPGFTICAQPRKILARELCVLVRENRMEVSDKTVDYRIARESSRDEAAKVLYCTAVVVALIMQLHIQGATLAHKPEDVATVICDEVHNRSVQSDYAVALTLAAMQVSGRIRLVLMSAMGDHDLPFCQQVVLTCMMHKIHRIFMSQPIRRHDQLFFNMAQVIIARCNERAGLALVHTV